MAICVARAVEEYRQARKSKSKSGREGGVVRGEEMEEETKENHQALAARFCRRDHVMLLWSKVGLCRICSLTPLFCLKSTEHLPIHLAPPILLEHGSPPASPSFPTQITLCSCCRHTAHHPLSPTICHQSYPVNTCRAGKPGLSGPVFASDTPALSQPPCSDTPQTPL